MSPVDLRRAALDDIVGVEALLAAASLPTAGVLKHLRNFIVAEQSGEIVGAIGLEPYADSALLRSAVVAPEWQGRGLGRSLVERLIGEAAGREIDTLYLLTTTAERYFATFGFTPVQRDTVPGLVRTSVEFRGACPASAVAMRLNIRDE